jgi:ABC-type phosphate transport system substrate-binding protein
MATMEAMMGQPVDLSYRAVGSTTGKAEFLEKVNDWGCSEVPVSEAEKAANSATCTQTATGNAAVAEDGTACDDVTALADNTACAAVYTKASTTDDANSDITDVAACTYATADTILQLPLVLGAMSAFHSVPADVVGTEGLRLSPCMLGMVFSRQVTRWNDPRLRDDNGVAVNAALANVDAEITVFHRDKGSSTTNFFTKYLHESTIAESCSTAWQLGWGQALTTDADAAKYATVTGTWPADTVTVQGSGGMSASLRATPFSVGYIDSGHGHNDGLSEVMLKNAAGTWLSSQTAGTAGIQGAVPASLPAADGNWEALNLINQAGANTWPIVATSYMLVHQDQTGSGQNGQLLKAYLRYTMDSTAGGGQSLAATYNFVAVSDALVQQNVAAINSITVDSVYVDSAYGPQTVDPFLLEYSTNTCRDLSSSSDSADVRCGATANTMSVKRQSHLLNMIAAHQAEIDRIANDLDFNTGNMLVGHAASLPLELHGSGTTNPSKLMWKLMATLKGMGQRPMQLSCEPSHLTAAAATAAPLLSFRCSIIGTLTGAAAPTRQTAPSAPPPESPSSQLAARTSDQPKSRSPRQTSTT